VSLSVNIRKKLGDFQLNISFQAEKEILALLGASGCGKSMTLKCIAGIETPDEGQIILDGRVLYDSKQNINLPPQKRNVGYLFQSYALFPHMTVRQNIASGIRGGKVRKQAMSTEKMKALYLEGLEDKYPFQLSGGQQQRVALARILASEPELILLDEPFSALDSYLKWQLEQELMDTLKSFAGTTLFVSHSRDEVYRLCQSVCVINDGTSEPVQTVKQLFDKPNTLSAALLTGCKNYSAARQRNQTEIEATDWGLTLSCDGREIPDDLQYIGVRAHYITFQTQAKENCFPCSVTRVIEDVFSVILSIAPRGIRSANASIRVELSKEAWEYWKQAETIFFHIDPKQILFLK
jgi:molybdate transport system ATP-binding protein